MVDDRQHDVDVADAARVSYRDIAHAVAGGVPVSTYQSDDSSHGFAASPLVATPGTFRTARESFGGDDPEGAAIA